MKRTGWRAAGAALLLMGLLIGCGGAAGETAGTTAPATESAAAVAQPTKPPPVIAANTVPAAAVAEAQPTAAMTDGAAEPALPTPLPTAETTAAPPTEAPTEAPTAAPTAVPPTAAPPTAIPPTVAPPTATAVPPTPAPAIGANGLIASHFALQDRDNLSVNGDIWFEFTVANSSGGDVPFGALGVMPKKDGVDRPQWYQRSYGGNNDVIPPSGLTWDDHINLPEAGNYTLRLAICFEDYGACLNNPGQWRTLSQEIPITVR